MQLKQSALCLSNQTLAHDQQTNMFGLNTYKSKTNPVHAWASPYGSRRLRIPEFLDIRHIKAASLSALLIGRLYPTEDIPCTHFS
jgi:hypothetical protein